MQTLFIAAFVLSFATSIHAQWKSVRVGGGGLITSIVAHPKVQNLYFITTDVGTPYRWNATSQAWEGLFYNLPSNYWGKNAAGNIAVDPSDATGNVIYATIGGPWINGGLLKSTDRGSTWTDCNLSLDVKPNNDQSYGQRLAVDPNNSNIVYVTTRPISTSGVTQTSINGTFKSTDAGATWVKINGLCGAFLAFDVSGGTASGVTKNIYIGCTDGIYQSTDGGTTFALMSGSPDHSSRAAIHQNGTMYITHYKNIAKWNGTAWSDVTPPVSLNYQAIAVNPNNSDQVIAGLSSWSPYRYDQFVSNNGGASWTAITPSPDLSENPWFSNSVGQGLSSFCWDPFDQNMVWFGDFHNPFQTTNIWAGATVSWKSRATGEEETVAEGNLLCPPSGVNVLLSSAADVGGFDHKSLTSPPTVGMISLFPWTTSGDVGNMTGVAVKESNPNFIVRVGRHGWSGAGYAGYSTDGGNTYTKWTCPSDAAGGRIAVSCKSDTMVWATQSGPCYRSTDRGTTWTVVASLPTQLVGGGANVFNSGAVFPIAADKVNGNKFYVYNAGKMYVSTDGGATFAVGYASLPNPWSGNPLVVETTPGKEGDVWIAMNSGGLFHSTNSGTSFSQIANVQIANSVSIGMTSPGTPTVPAVYVYGMVNNIPDGLFRSNDNGATWQIISAPIHTGSGVYSMAADRQVYGRVFFATTGNGIRYVEDMNDTIPPSAPANFTALRVDTTSCQLSWTPAIDNVSVANYSFYVNGVYQATLNGVAYTLTGLSKNTTYTLSLKSKDLAGNLSTASTIIITTPAVYVPPVNIALSKPVTASTQQSSNLATYANDGDVTTKWAATNGYNGGDWVKIDLVNNYNISGVEILWTRPEWIYDYKIDVSNDNTTWFLASDKTSNTYYTSVGGASEINFFTANNYRYIRITVTGWGNGGYWASLKEFRVFGTLVTPTGTKQLSTPADWRMYPNPVTDLLNFDNVKLNADVSVSSLNGMVLYHNKGTSSSSFTLPVTNWSKGIYLVQIKDENGVAVKKLIVK